MMARRAKPQAEPKPTEEELFEYIRNLEQTAKEYHQFMYDVAQYIRFSARLVQSDFRERDRELYVLYQTKVRQTISMNRAVIRHMSGIGNVQHQENIPQEGNTNSNAVS